MSPLIDHSPAGISRRRLLRDTGIAVAGTAVAVAVCLASLWPAGRAIASGPAVPRSCLAEATATVTFQGSGFLGARTGREHGTGTYFACHLDDPSIHSGTATFDSQFTFDCRTLQFSDVGTYTIRWNNGRKTKISYSARMLAPALAVGHVSSGEFKGQQTVDYDLIAPLSPNICTETSGSLNAAGVGLLTIGSPPITGRTELAEVLSAPPQ